MLNLRIYKKVIMKKQRKFQLGIKKKQILQHQPETSKHVFTLHYIFDAARKVIFSDAVRNQTSSRKSLLDLFKRASKVNLHNSLEILTNEKHFPKTISQ